jgi:hypothetical protein
MQQLQTMLRRQPLLRATNFPLAVLESNLLGVYIILIPAVGYLISGLVMLKGIFSKSTAYLGLVSGILGIISVVGSVFVSFLGVTIIIASFLTTVWVLLVGYKLFRLSKQ